MDWFELMRDLKEKSGMTNHDIAEKSSVPEPTLEKIFSGATRKPGINTVIDIIHAMGGTLDLIDPAAKEKQPDDNDGLSNEAVEVVNLLRKVPERDLPLATALVKSVLLTVLQHSPIPEEKQSRVPAVSSR